MIDSQKRRACKIVYDIVLKAGEVNRFMRKIYTFHSKVDKIQ